MDKFERAMMIGVIIWVMIALPILAYVSRFLKLDLTIIPMTFLGILIYAGLIYTLKEVLK